MRFDKKFIVLALVAGLMAVSAGAQDLPRFLQPETGLSAGGGCTAPQPAVLPSVREAEILLFALPIDQVSTAETVTLSVLDGPREVLRETFDLADAVGASSADQEFVVFEALAESPRDRGQLRLWTERFADRYSVELRVAERTLVRWSAGEFAAQSQDARRLGVLPTGVATEIERPERNVKFRVCGDNSCDGGTFPNGEDCETCPQDCGSCSGICGNNFCGPNESCSTCSADCGSCPSCPTDLGEEDRTVLLGSSSLGWQCMQGQFYPYESEYFDYTRFDYKTYRVDRVRECDGSITETVVPGSTSYFSSYCYRYTGVFCYNGFLSPSCITY